MKKHYTDSNIIFAFNKDYSKYSIKRDNLLIKTCDTNSIKIINDDDYSDYCLVSWKDMLKNDVSYKQFGAFYKNSIKSKVQEPLDYKNKYKYFIKNNTFEDLFKKIEFTKFDSLIDSDINIIVNKDLQWLNAGRNKCLKRLEQDIDNLKQYNNLRNNLSYNTSNISAYLNIGSVSIREVYKMFKLKLDNDLIKQLYWRDFYLCVVKYMPNGNNYSHIDDRYDKINWHSNLLKSSNEYKTMKHWWDLMMSSQTGFLLIDAGIQELKQTGFMHGRNRMIVGMFWTKYLLINPFDNKYGSQTGYSRFLVDAIGPSQNKMNHQWITEFDFPGKKYAPSNASLAGRPMRIDNEQIKKFDPECIYIKKWLPHLKNVDNKDIYKWSQTTVDKYNLHVAPIFNPKEKYQEWINLCKNN